LVFIYCSYDSLADEKYPLHLYMPETTGDKKDDVTGEWRQLHGEELHNLYSSPNIVRQIKKRRMNWAGHVARMGEERKMYKILVGEPEGKRPYERPRRRWEDGIRLGLRGISGEGCGWSGFSWFKIWTGGGLL
jgi:hypothetical protein